MSDAAEAEARVDIGGVAVTIDGRTIHARQGELVIAAAERHGVYIPRFCYHPRMTPVGMCRMCIVEIDTGRGPALQPSCMIPVADEMVVSTNSPATKKAQDGVLEFLLINHPLDCPVCDKGGECPLQDQTLAYGPGESRFVEEKRHFEKPIPISATVMLDRERCILCDRCTRFAAEVAGDPLIHFLDRGNQTQVNTFPDEPFSSYFSGNTVQICPVGALTAKPYRFRARPWDLEQTESTCTSCSVGCRVVIDGSRNRVLRYNGIDSDPVNWGWLCDKGRFDFEAVHHDDRLGEPLVRGGATDGEGGRLAEVRWSDPLPAAAAAIKAGIDASGPGGLAVLGGARLTNEDAYAWAKLAKGVLGTDHVDAQLGDGLPAETVLGLPRATIDEACTPGGTIVVLGPDLKEELPVLFLRLRHAVIQDGARLVELAPGTTGLTALAAASLRYRPGDSAGLVRQLVAGDTPTALDGQAERAAHQLAAELLGGDVPLTVILGRPSLGEAGASIAAAATLLAEARPRARFLSALRRANVHGALDMGLAPGLLPGRVSLDDGRAWFAERWPTVPAERGLDAAGILTAAADGRIDTLVLLGADPLADFPDHDLASRALAGARTVIALDLFLTESARRADVVLPAAGYAECDGTTTNLEGRISRLAQKVTPPGTARSDWMIAAELAWRLGADLGLESVDQITDEIERVAPSHAGITAELVASGQAADGVLAPLPVDGLADVADATRGVEGSLIDGGPTDLSGEGDEGAAVAQGEAGAAATDAAATDEPDEQMDAEAAATESSAEAAAEGDVEASPADAEPPAEVPAPQADTARPPLLRCRRTGAPEAEPPPVDNYSLRLVVTRKLYDQGTLVQHSPSIAGLAPGTTLRVSPLDFERLGVAPGAQVRATSSRGSVTVAAGPDPGLPRGTAALVFNQADVVAATLLDATAPVTELRVESK
ncbi:NADH-quinone oxidoreductase subunit G [soil metagenome]